MTEAKRQKYTKELKQDAVRLVTEQGYTIAKAARNLGINDNLIGRWKREILKKATVFFASQKP